MYYDYIRLLNAVKENETQENLENLVEWFHMYGMQFFNGEYYDCGPAGRIYPVTEWSEFYDCAVVSGYEFRRD